MASIKIYIHVLMTFVTNNLVRDMSFRANFLLQCLSSMSWAVMNLGFYLIIFVHVQEIGPGSGWGKYEFFVFLGTTWIVNSVLQAFFMPNIQGFSELIRTGNLDFALLKPIDTQFLISFQRIEWASFANGILGFTVIVVGMSHITGRTDAPLPIGGLTIVLYLFYLGCGVIILYSLMISLAATSIWLGRNQTLYDFWFYITNFSRYPMEMYQHGWGKPLWGFFTFIVPVLLVINIPARIMARPLYPDSSVGWQLALFTCAATLASLFVSRRIFQRAVISYRSASS